MRIRYYSRREARAVAESASRDVGYVYGKPIEPVVEVDSGGRQFLVLCKGGIVLVGVRDGHYVPAMTDPDAVERVRHYILVDRGAVRHIVNGAHVMRPGIKGYSEFGLDDVVVVRELDYKRPIALGVAVVGSSTLPAMERGQVVRNVHHLRDWAWDTLNGGDLKNMIEKLG